MGPDLPTEKGITLRALHAEGDEANSSRPAPMFIPRINEESAQARPRTVWDDSVPGVDQGDVAARWLQSFLKKDGLRLVLIADSAKRPTDATFGVGETGFADGFPVLVTSEASVQETTRRLPADSGVDVNSFRPNVHVSGCRPFEEDEIRAFAFDGIRVSMVKPCARCTVPTVNQRTGGRIVTGEPLRTLRDVRSGKRLRAVASLHKKFFDQPDMEHEAFFGQNAILDFKVGAVLQVGDEAVVEW